MTEWVFIFISGLWGAGAFWIAWKGRPLFVEGATHVIQRVSLWRSRRQAHRLWPEALVLLAGFLRAGAHPEEAFDLLTTSAPEPLRTHIQACLQPLPSWAPLMTKVDRLFQHRDLRLPRLAWRVGVHSGSGLAPILEESARLMRLSRHIRQKRQTLLLPSLITAAVAVASPFLLLAGLWVIAPHELDVFWETDIGRRLFFLCGLLIGAGLVWIVRVVKKDSQ